MKLSLLEFVSPGVHGGWVDVPVLMQVTQQHTQSIASMLSCKLCHTCTCANIVEMSLGNDIHYLTSTHFSYIRNSTCA